MPLYFNLGYFSIVRLATFILSLSISVYLFSIKRKSISTTILACAFFGATLFNVSLLLEHANPYYWQPNNYQNVIRSFLLDIGPSIAILSFLLFSYYFPHFEKTEKREYRKVLFLAVLLNLGTLGLTFYNFIILQIMQSNFEFEVVYLRVLASSLGMQFFLVIFLLIRKTVRLSSGETSSGWLRFIKPLRRDAKATRALAIVLLLPLVTAIAYLLRYLGILPPVITIHFVWYIFLLFYSSSIVTYLNHTEESTTFQVKLVGGALVVMFVIMEILAIVVGRSYERDYVNENLITDHTTLNFAPNHDKSYNITSAPFQFDSDLGFQTGITYSGVKSIELEFSFPFFDKDYNKIHVLSGPMIYLGEEIRENGWGGYRPQPAIAPIIMNLDPSSGGGIFLKSEIKSVTITWYEIPEFDRSPTNTVQLVLYDGGSFNISYVQLNPDPTNRTKKIDVSTTANITGTVLGGGVNRGISFEPRLIGIHPGGRNAQLQPIRFLKDLPYLSRAPGAIFEAYDIDYYQYIHNRMAPLAVVLLGSSIFILFFFPILLKNSLIKPLRVLYEGMEKVDRGDMDITIAPRFNDELGFLTRSFNRMLLSIRNAESNFRTLAENAHDGIFIILDSGALIYANKCASTITGYDSHELMEISFNTLVQPDVFNKLKEQHRKSPKVKQIVKPFEAFLRTKKGEHVPVELMVSRTIWHGKFTKVVVVRDITERKRSEEQARQQQQQMMKMDKLTSLGILVAGVAHEINNPNQTILSNSSFLVRASHDLLSILRNYNDENEEFLIAGLEYADFQKRFSVLTTEIEECSNRIDGIVSGLRAFSQDDPGYLMSGLNVNTVIKSAIDLLDNYIKRATENFSLKLEKEIPKIKGNAQRIEQVIINLILNACQSLTSREQAISVRSFYEEKKNAILIIVRDDGMGIPEEHLAEIKNAFFTTKRTQGGTGLGLYVSESIVKEHNGTLAFESWQGKGTVATISLPVAEGL